VRIPLAVVGISHETAPIEVRERVAFASPEAREALVALRREAGVEEAVLLSTCNRTEVYLFPARSEASVRAVERLFSEKAGRGSSEVAKYLFQEWGEDAVRHLFEVSAGLDSMVMGEAEIQGQVRDAYLQAARLEITPPMAGPILNRLFQMALSVGGRVRAETSIGEGSASVASVAVELAQKIFGTLHGKRVLIIGAGATGELILNALSREGVEEILVANRTYERALSLAQAHAGRAIPIESLQDYLASTDIVLSSTAAPEPVLTRSIVRASFVEPRRHPLLVIDIAVPRDVDPDVGKEPEVYLYNVDDLRKIVEDHVNARRDALPDAERIVHTHSDEFRAWYASLGLVPLIRRIRERADSHREAELARLFRGLEGLAPEDRERIEDFARRLQSKLLHDSVTRLRKGAPEGEESERLVQALHYLYSGEEG
jgi:glutamyl-tRNA reductase